MSIAPSHALTDSPFPPRLKEKTLHHLHPHITGIKLTSSPSHPLALILGWASWRKVGRKGWPLGGRWALRDNITARGYKGDVGRTRAAL